jgi:hypothetical protein
LTRIVSKEESEIRLKEDGRWVHQGELFSNRKIIEFFHRAIRKDGQGRYYLHNVYEGKEEHVYFEVEDTAYFIEALEFDEKAQALLVTLNTGDNGLVDLRGLQTDERGVIYCRVLDDDRARLTPNAMQQLADLSRMDDGGVYVDLTGEKVYIGGR